MHAQQARPKGQKQSSSPVFSFYTRQMDRENNNQRGFVGPQGNAYDFRKPNTISVAAAVWVRHNLARAQWETRI